MEKYLFLQGGRKPNEWEVRVRIGEAEFARQVNAQILRRSGGDNGVGVGRDYEAVFAPTDLKWNEAVAYGQKRGQVVNANAQ